MTRLFLILLLFAMFPLSGTSQAAVPKSPTYLLCQSHKHVRTIRVVDKKGACTTIYTKFGIDRVVGSGRFVISCIGFMNNVRNNLEKAGWKCKDISSAIISEVNN